MHLLNQGASCNLCAQANFSTDCRGMQAQLTGLASLIKLLDPQLSAFLVRGCAPLSSRYCHAIGMSTSGMCNFCLW